MRDGGEQGVSVQSRDRDRGGRKKKKKKIVSPSPLVGKDGAFVSTARKGVLFTLTLEEIVVFVVLAHCGLVMRVCLCDARCGV